MSGKEVELINDPEGDLLAAGGVPADASALASLESYDSDFSASASLIKPKPIDRLRFRVAGAILEICRNEININNLDTAVLQTITQILSSKKVKKDCEINESTRILYYLINAKGTPRIKEVYGRDIEAVRQKVRQFRDNLRHGKHKKKG